MFNLSYASMSSAVINRNMSEKKEGMIRVWMCVSLQTCMVEKQAKALRGAIKRNENEYWNYPLTWIFLWCCVYVRHHAVVVSCQFVSYLFQDLQIMMFSCWLLLKQAGRVSWQGGFFCKNQVYDRSLVNQVKWRIKNLNIKRTICGFVGKKFLW